MGSADFTRARTSDGVKERTVLSPKVMTVEGGGGGGGRGGHRVYTMTIVCRLLKLGRMNASRHS
jgi:hypothetical protein